MRSVRIFSSTSLSPTYPLPHTKVHYQLHVSNIKNVHGGEWPLTCQDSCGSLQNLPRISYDGHRSQVLLKKFINLKVLARKVEGLGKIILE